MGAGVQMYVLNSTYSREFMDSQSDMDSMRTRILDGLYSMHMVTPKTLHWIQAVRDGDDVARLQIEHEIAPAGHCYECARETPPSELQMQATIGKVPNVFEVPDGLEIRALGDSCSVVA